jgi:hypothetical protein
LRQRYQAASSLPRPTPARPERSAILIVRCASGAGLRGTGWPARIERSTVIPTRATGDFGVRVFWLLAASYPQAEPAPVLPIPADDPAA